MSGDVKAAIERTCIRRDRWAFADTPASPVADAVTLMAEVERLRTALDFHKRVGGDTKRAMVDAEREVERLRAENERIAGDGGLLHTLQRDNVNLANERTRLLAEREALRSDETRERIRALVSRQARALGDGSITPGVLATLLMNLLSDDAEADQ